MTSFKTCVITGANTGIGAACAVQLAAPSVHVVLACRSESRAAPVLDAVRARGARATFLRLDLASLSQATEAATSLAIEHGRIDLLVNNAGLGGQRGLTQDGYELAFGVNHLGHFAFTMPLLGALERAGGRVVNVSSRNHEWARGIPWERLRARTRSWSGLPEYGVSKLCNVLFTAELRRRRPKIAAVAMHPGRIESDIFRRIPRPLYPLFKLLFPMDPVDVGGSRLAHAATTPLGTSAPPLYFDRDRRKEPNPLALREELAAELWAYSERAVAGALGAPRAAAA